MKLYTRSDFIKLPAGTIYSRRLKNSCELMDGLFCKTSGPGYGNDWIEQNLISEPGYPNGITDGMEAIIFVEGLRDSFLDFETDLHCAGRDGCFDDEDLFVVWSKNDVKKLADYLYSTIK